MIHKFRTWMCVIKKKFMFVKIHFFTSLDKNNLVILHTCVCVCVCACVVYLLGNRFCSNT